MGILRDYIAYAKEHVNPKLSEEAQQRLIQAYVDMRKVIFTLISKLLVNLNQIYSSDRLW